MKTHITIIVLSLVTLCSHGQLLLLADGENGVDEPAILIGTRNTLTNRTQDFIKIQNGTNTLAEWYPDGSLFIGKNADDGPYLNDPDLMIYGARILDKGDRKTLIWRASASDTTEPANMKYYAFASFVVTADPQSPSGQYFAEAFDTNGNYFSTIMSAGGPAFTAKDANDAEPRILLNPYLHGNYPAHIFAGPKSREQFPNGVLVRFGLDQGPSRLQRDVARVLNNGTVQASSFASRIDGKTQINTININESPVLFTNTTTANISVTIADGKLDAVGKNGVFLGQDVRFVNLSPKQRLEVHWRTAPLITWETW